MCIPTIKITCDTCRKCKLLELCKYKCKYEPNEFYPFNRIGCEHWLPFKVDIKARTNAAKNTNKTKE